MRNKLIVMSVLIALSIASFAQTGTLKIFSEVDSIDIYLDETYKGRSTSTIDGLKPGSYYLKVLRKDVVILSDIVGVQPNQTTTVLIKMTDDIKKKLLQGMAPQIAEYKSKKMTVYEGSYTKWHVRIGGTQISDIEYLKLSKDTAALNRMERDKKTQRIRTIIGLPLIIVGGAFYVYAVYKAASEEPIVPGANTDFLTNAMYIAIGAIPFGTGMYLTAAQSHKRYMIYEDAVEYAKKYNAKLKEDLKLPSDFEPAQ